MLSLSRSKEVPRRASSTTTTTQPPRRLSLPFLAKKRRRALSPPFPLDPRPAPRLVDQDCAFLDLPYEVREVIYHELLGGAAIAVKEIEDRYARRARLKKGDQLPVAKASGIVSMLQSCRQVYLELRPLILSHPLSIPSQPSFHALIALLPSHHFPLLTNLHLHADFPYLLFPRRDPPRRGTWLDKTTAPIQHFDAVLWASTWSALAELTGLRELRVTVRARDYTASHPGWPSRPVEEVASILWAPVIGAELVGLRKWVVEVSWKVGKEDLDGKREGGLPFVLRRIGVDDEEALDGERDEVDGESDGESDGAMGAGW